MITFYPGPSRLYSEVETYLAEAFHSGLLSMNHRSQPFMDMLAETMVLMKQKLLIPDSYQIVFTSSATECWEIIAQSLTGSKSYHLYNGAFGQKWFDYANRIHGRSIGSAYNLDEQPNLPDHESDSLLCLTHTETSNGSVISDSSLVRLREAFKGLIAVDATSSMGGVALPWETADVWYASVQKCFGLPSGLAVMVLSPAAVERTILLNENRHYNSLGFVVDNFKKFQTPYTPNILGIFLMNRLMNSIQSINLIGSELERRSLSICRFLEENGMFPLVRNPECRSHTVIAVEDSGEKVAAVKVFAREREIVLGNGYGRWKETSFRIANFPAIPEEEFERLRECLYDFSRYL